MGHGRAGSERTRGTILGAARRGATPAAACLAIAALAACARGGDGEHRARGAASAERRASGEARDACELIPPAQVAAIAGGPVVTESEPGSRESSCTYVTREGRLEVLWVTVSWTGGREQLRTVQGGTGMAASLMREPGVDVDSIVRPGQVAGLGDAAFYSDIMPSYVLTDDTLLELGMMNLPDARSHFRPLAGTALSRL